jgi:hypothetical protein
MGEEVIYVRGIPVSKLDVYVQQERLGAQLFDESMFRSLQKQIACATVISQLDVEYRKSIEKKGPLGVDEIRRIDIGDPSWLYIPVNIFGPDTGVVMMPSKNSPGGKMAWFRYRRQFQSRSLY